MQQYSRAPRWRRSLTLISLTAVGLLAGAGVASAHVTVNPSEAAAGGFTKLTFRVPNESPTAGTVAVTVDLPADHPFAYVSVKQVPGWSVVPTTSTLAAPVTEGDVTIKEAVTSVTWTADPGTTIGPGEFAEFDISAGPVPDTESLAFPTTQTYNDGAVVQWNEPTPASGEEPEHPAPTLTVGPAEGSGHGATDPTAATPASDPSVAAVAATSSSGSDSTATILAAVSLVIAAAALVVAAVALRRRPAGNRE